MFSNNLTKAEIERLAYLAEECGEVIQIVGKVLRHGYESTDPTSADGPTNRAALGAEVADLQYAVALMTERGDADVVVPEGNADERRVARARHFHHQQALP